MFGSAPVHLPCAYVTVKNELLFLYLVILPIINLLCNSQANLIISCFFNRIEKTMDIFVIKFRTSVKNPDKTETQYTIIFYKVYSQKLALMVQVTRLLFSLLVSYNAKFVHNLKKRVRCEIVDYKDYLHNIYVNHSLYTP